MIKDNHPSTNKKPHGCGAGMCHSLEILVIIGNH